MTDYFNRIPYKPDWLLLALLIFIPRLLDLDTFLTADEPLFLEHAREFAAGLSGGDFSRTLGIGYPGVTVAAWAAPLVGLAGTELGAYAAGRAVTAFFGGLMLLLTYGLARSLLGRWPALIGVVLLALDPYSLAYSRLFHIAMPLALLMTLAGLSLLLWLRQRRSRWLILTGVFSGLALLTKSTALLLGPMLVGMILAWGWLAACWRDGRWWWTILKGGLIIVFVAGLIFTLFWPAMWLQPGAALELTFGKLFTDQEAGAGNLGMFWFGRFVEDPGVWFYPIAFLLKSTPWLLAGLLLSLIYCGIRLKDSRLTSRLQPTGEGPAADDRRKSQSQPDLPGQSLPVTVSLWLFALVYLLIMTIASKKSVRYLLPAFPVFYLLAGLAFYQSLQSLQSAAWLQKRLKSGALSHRPAYLLPILALLILFSAVYHPYYLTYYNPLLLGWRWAPQALLVGWGEGLDGAARYLNEQPPQQVSAWYEWLFPLLYQGQVQPVVPQENMLTAGRTVLYINQVQRDIPGPNIIHYFRTRRRPEYTVRLNGIDYAWVYPGPVAGFRAGLTPAYPLGGEFGGEARLLGYDLQPETAAGGDALVVTLYWQSLTSPAADRFVYVRLVDAGGRVWARADGPPVMGLWPATKWQPEMVIEDAVELPVPAGTPPGSYRLEVGLYDPDTGQPLVATGQPVGGGGGLLLGEVTVEWRARPELDAGLAQRVDVQLSPAVRLIGYDLPAGETMMTGDIIPLRLAWREARSLLSLSIFSTAADTIGFKWQKKGEDSLAPVSQSSPFPFPVDRWGRGAVLLSQHDLITPPELAAGEYELLVLLLAGDGRPAAEPFSLGLVNVDAPPHRFELPAGAVPPLNKAARLGGSVNLAGYEAELTGQALELDLYWQTEAALTTPYKVFAQLLDADNQLVAQSDAVPAAGQRPTTGWLPQEIIADSHTLPLPVDLSQPPAGRPYRLIAGLYDPLTGQRLPVLDDAGQAVADAILVAEVTLP